MFQSGSTPGLPLRPLRAGISVGAGALGLAALTLALAVSGKPAASLLADGLFALIFGGVAWLASRHRQEYLRFNLDRVPARQGQKGPRRAFLVGLLLAAVLAVAETLVVTLMAWWFGGSPSVANAVPGLLLGIALWVTLDLRDLRRWELDSGYLVFTRAGSRLVAFTYGQARRQLVAVARRAQSRVT